jgi:hypothetical protein
MNHQEPGVSSFLSGKPDHSIALFDSFIREYRKIGEIKVEATKSMIGISNSQRRIAWVTQIGKNFIHVVFPFKKQYAGNLCFQKIARVPGQDQFNHHFRMLLKEDVNAEVTAFMKLAFAGEKTGTK